MKKNNSDHHTHHDGHNSSHAASPHSPQPHPSPPPAPSGSHQHHPSPTSPHLGHHAHHIQEFKKRFWLSLLLTIPVLLFSEMIQSWFQFRLVIPYQKLVLFFLSSVIYFYGGWPFLKGAAKELKN
ncbi:MAG: heavy metal translocating P-type ATPase, partial [Candidatus Aminicenantes bacterium]|nr:heavy metal translocating P-type ATPase [Candidatus Aminicenantes bacterium]